MNEGAFRFLIPAPTLQDLAAFNIGLQLWRCNWYTGPAAPAYLQLINFFKGKCTSITSTINNEELPDAIKHIITDEISSIKKKILSWSSSRENCSYTTNSDPLYAENLFTYFPRSCDDIVWRATDFTIDRTQTVENLLKSDHLNDFQKFKLACSHCLVEHIDHLWTKVSFMWKPKVISLIRDRHLRYWIQRKGVTLQNTVDISDLDMICSVSRYNTSAFDYYWNRVSDASTDDILSSVKNFEHVLPKLTEQQWNDFVAQRGLIMMSQLVEIGRYGRNSLEHEFILQVWRYCGSMMSGVGFCNIMLHPYFDHYCKTDADCIHKELWRMAPDHLKTIAWSELFNIERGTLLRNPKALEFFQTELRSVSYELRSEFFWKHWSTILTRYSSPQNFQKIISWIFSENEIIQFKKDIHVDFHRIRNKCIELLEQRNLIDLHHVWSWSSSNELEILDLKRRTVEACLNAQFLKQYNLLTQMQTEMIDLFRNIFGDTELASKFKNDMVLVVSHSESFANTVTCNSLLSFKNFAESCVSSEEILVQVKRNFAENYTKHLKKGYFCSETGDLDELNEFLLWCLEEDETKIFEFKRSFTTAKTVEAIFKLRESDPCSRLECFMKWKNSVSSDLSARKRRRRI